MPSRLRRVWRLLPPERRLAAAASVGLILTLFLPWYQETVIPTGVGVKVALPSASLTGWAAFSFVEAAVLLVSVAVLILLFVRAEGGAFHVPGGDGGVITAAGGWTCLLIVWRMFDKQSTARSAQFVTTSGIEWGIFIALGVAAVLVYAGSRIRLAHEPEPPLPGERPRRPRPAPAEKPATQALPTPADEAGTQPMLPPAAETQPLPAGADENQTQPLPDPARSDPSGSDAGQRPHHRRTGARPHRGLDFNELDQIEFDAPPEAPTVRRRAPDTEDHLTTRLDRPD